MRKECEDVDQQPRGGEEAPGEHAGGSALSVPGVQEEIPSSQRGNLTHTHTHTHIYTYAYIIHLYHGFISLCVSYMHVNCY